MHIDSDQFALFAWNGFYPAGGWHDFVGVFSSSDEAATAGKEFEHWHIVNTDTLEKVLDKYEG